MNWVNKGLIYTKSATTPVPILLAKNVIRVYVGFPDVSGISRIGYVDVDARNPKEILRVSKKPVLDIGFPGTFDDNGVILGDVVRTDSTLRMYYVGFQHVQKIKFMAFAGLAVSRNHGESFKRVKETPILDRTVDARFIRAIHSVVKEGQTWNIWSGEGDSWEIINGKPYPRYEIYHYESSDGINFGDRRIAIRTRGNEYRIGRPRVYKTEIGYEMYYTVGTRGKKFFPGYAISRDGIKWNRKDSEITLRNVLYPALIRYHELTYMFYDSPGFGASGFGYAILAAK